MPIGALASTNGYVRNSTNMLINQFSTYILPVEDIRPLRWKVLRPNQPYVSAIYPGDDNPETKHFGIVVADTIVSVGSVYHEPPPGINDVGYWRLRGMATNQDMQNKGYGSRILRCCTDYVRDCDGEILWCNARSKAVNFYVKSGFEIFSPEFEIPEIGLHYLMKLTII